MPMQVRLVYPGIKETVTVLNSSGSMAGFRAKVRTR